MNKLIQKFNYIRPAKYHPRESGKTEQVVGAIVVTAGFSEGSILIDRIGDGRQRGAVELDGIEEARILRRLLTTAIRKHDRGEV